jgi:hypothetical protein
MGQRDGSKANERRGVLLMLASTVAFCLVSMLVITASAIVLWKNAASRAAQISRDVEGVFERNGA